ncbi:unnamed protein product [Caretta caretta]
MMWISQTAYKEETELEAVSYQLLEQVTILFSQVVVTILSNPNNSNGWILGRVKLKVSLNPFAMPSVWSGPIPNTTAFLTE